MTQDKPGVPKPKKEGWKNQTKEFKTAIVMEKHFQGIVFMLGQVPLRKIGIEIPPVVIAGMPTKIIVNAAYKNAPPHRIIFSKDGVKCYVKGMSPVLMS
jgi:hypothetical protein